MLDEAYPWGAVVTWGKVQLKQIKKYVSLNRNIFHSAVYCTNTDIMASNIPYWLVMIFSSNIFVSLLSLKRKRTVVHGLWNINFMSLSSMRLCHTLPRFSHHWTCRHSWMLPFMSLRNVWGLFFKGGRRELCVVVSFFLICVFLICSDSHYIMAQVKVLLLPCGSNLKYHIPVV